jgi:predicted secreted protein
MAKFTGKGAEILVKTSGATPGFVAVGQVAEIGEIAISADEVDVTTLDAGDYRQFIQGFKDPGECQLTVLWDAGMADQGDTADGLWGLFKSGEVRDWVVRWNSSEVGGETFGQFQGFIRDWSFGALNPDDPQQIQPTVRITGPLTISDTMPTITTAPEDQLKRDQADIERRAKQLAADQARLRARAQIAQEPIAA